LIAIKLLPGLFGMLCAGLATGLPVTSASAQSTCFGKGSVLTCIGQPGAPMLQMNCFGNSNFKTCYQQSGNQVTLSSTPTSLNNGNISSAFQSSVSGVPAMGAAGTDPAFGVAPSAVSIDPAFGTPIGMSVDPLANSAPPTTAVTRPPTTAVTRMPTGN
jgi:hypothetical protein